MKQKTPRHLHSNKKKKRFCFLVIFSLQFFLVSSSSSDDVQFKDKTEKKIIIKFHSTKMKKKFFLEKYSFTCSIWFSSMFILSQFLRIFFLSVLARVNKEQMNAFKRTAISIINSFVVKIKKEKKNQFFSLLP